MMTAVVFSDLNDVPTTETSTIEILGNVYTFEALLLRNTAGILSNLTITAATDLNGLSVRCDHQSTDIHELQIVSEQHDLIILSVVTNIVHRVLHTSFIIIAAPPSTLNTNVNVTGIQNETFYSTITLQWNPNTHNVTTNYTVTVSSDLAMSSTWKTNTESKTSVILRLPYNVNHTIGIEAANCAGARTMIELSGLMIGGQKETY